MTTKITTTTHNVTDPPCGKRRLYVYGMVFSGPGSAFDDAMAKKLLVGVDTRWAGHVAMTINVSQHYAGFAFSRDFPESVTPKEAVRMMDLGPFLCDFTKGTPGSSFVVQVFSNDGSTNMCFGNIDGIDGCLHSSSESTFKNAQEFDESLKNLTRS